MTQTPHKRIIPGTQGACPSNTVVFTDYPVVRDVTLIRKTHMDQLRVAINAEQTRRYKINTVWTDPTIVANKTLPRKPHADDARNAIIDIRDPSDYTARSCPTNQDGCVCETHVIVKDLNNHGVDHNCTFCQDYCKTNIQGYCPSDISAAIVWTDPVITADQDHVRAVHMNEMMAAINVQNKQCVCELERCNYCADCGHSYQQWYTYCNHAGCACDDHKYGECTHDQQWAYNWVNNCSVIDSDASDFVVALASHLPPGITAGDQVPWNCMCSFVPTGNAWSNRKGHAVWGCMCNPFTWSG